jgi:hypothetical protein
MKRARITEARIGVNRQWNMESGLGVLQSSALGLCFISVRLVHSPKFGHVYACCAVTAICQVPVYGNHSPGS